MPGCRAVCFIILASTALCCVAATANGQKDIPAIITHPTDAGFETLTNVVSRAVGSYGLVLLASDALTRSSLLVIERKQIRLLGVSTTTRVSSRPDRFRLVLGPSALEQQSPCILVHLDTKERWTIPDIICTAE